MSLQLLAKQMEAKGRKGDSMLVHMTPEEVASLQKLAEAAGSSLTVNPETGLVEAFRLRNFIPALVGGAVGVATLNPFLGAAAGAAVGGYQAKENNQDVLLGAGLGALGGYGGAGIGAGLANAGATVAAEQAAAETAKNVVAEQAQQQFIADQAAKATLENAGQRAIEEQLAQEAGQQVASTGAENLLTTQTDEAARQAFLEQQSLADTSQITGSYDAARNQFLDQNFASKTGQGLQALGQQGGRDAFMSQVGGGMGLAKSGAAMYGSYAMAPGKLEEPEEIPVDDEMYYTEYTPGQTGERSSTSTESRQFAGRFSPMEKIKAADYMDRVRRRDIYSAAEGGEVADAGIAGGMAGNTGATANAMSYLMGQSPSSTGAATPGTATPGMPSASQAGLQYLMGQAPQSSVAQPQAQRTEFVVPTRAESVTSTLDGYREITEGPYQGLYEEVGGKLVFDPTAQKFHRAGNVFRYTPPPPVEAAPAYYGDSGGGNYGDYGGYGGGDDGLGSLSAESVAAAQAAAGFSDTGGYSDSPASTGDTGHSGADSDGAGGDWAKGGLLGLAKGGMRSGGFVIPADVVSMIGEGNTDAGYKRIKSIVPGATAIKGKDGGQADTVKTHIEGKQPARVAHGEMYVPPETVKRMGGAKKLYAMMDRVRQQATGSKKQIKPVSLKKALA